jgi:hypothetical protein
LAERDVVLDPIPESERDGLLEEGAFTRILERRMDRYPGWRVLSVHLAEMDLPSRFETNVRPTYIVEITGPRTGNCFDFYLATDGDYRGSACFYPTRP